VPVVPLPVIGPQSPLLTAMPQRLPYAYGKR